MAIRSCFLTITLFLSPVFAFGQGYEWSDRSFQVLGNGGPFWQVEASEYGVYAVSPGLLAKYRAEDGKLLWRRELNDLGSTTIAYSISVNARGVFVAGGFPVTGGTSSSFVRRYSHDGDIVWTTLGCCFDGGATAIDSDADGLYVGGYNFTKQDALLQHLNFAGETLWSREFPDSDNTFSTIVADGYVFVTTYSPLLVYRTNGDFVRSIPLPYSYAVEQGQVTYDAGFLYIVHEEGVTKYNIDGNVIWDHVFAGHPYDFGVLNGLYRSAIASSADGLFFTATIVPPQGRTLETGVALVRMGFDGSVAEVTPFWGHRVIPEYLSTLDGELYVAGSTGDRIGDPDATAFAGRYSDKALVAPSVLALRGAAPAQPPRLAVLYHDYGAGPVRAGVRDAAPGSIEYGVEFDEDLTPVAYDTVADLNGNGYEELVVVSRVPAVAEVRDSLDGSLLSRIKLGEHFDPIAADVEERAGQAPRLAVVVRNESTERLLVRVHDLASGALLDTLAYIRNFEPVDVLALPGSGNAHRYAVLSRNPLAGSPHKIEIRQTNSGLVENYWTNNDNEPLELALTGTAANPVLGVLLDRTDALRPRVWQVDLQTGAGSSLIFTDERMPVAMTVLPDSDGNGYPQLAVLSDTTNEEVKAELRDAQSGMLDGRINFSPKYRPQDVAYVGAVPGFSDSAIAVIGLKEVRSYARYRALVRVDVAGVDGNKLFNLNFRFGL